MTRDLAWELAGWAIAMALVGWACWAAGLVRL